MDTFQMQLVESDKRTSGLVIGDYVPDLHNYSRPIPIIFWLDFLLSLLTGNGFLYFAVKNTSFSPEQVLCIFISAVFLFRAGVFMHEAVHAAKQIPLFDLGYNFLHGFVHKLPLYIFGAHKHHHAAETYGTMNDPEYELLKGSPLHYVTPIFSQTVMPLLLLIRFGIVPALLPFIGEKGRNVIYQYASTFALNLRFKRSLPNEKERIEWYWQDAGCFFYNTIFFALMISGVWSWKVFFIWYAIFYLTFLFNFYRVMTSHTYSTNFNQTNRKLQILDSVTVTGSWILGLVFYPVGMRYHALHHLFPHIPYHNLARLHRSILTTIPAGHPYRETLVLNYFDALRRLPKA